MQGVESEEVRVGAIASPSRPTAEPLLIAARYLCLTALLVGVVGLAGRWLAWPLLTSTVGPTAYLFAAHPRTEASATTECGHRPRCCRWTRPRCVRALRLGTPPISVQGGDAVVAQVLASAAAVGVTMSVLELLHSHHAPAAATALLITTGLAKPGSPLIGLVVGLAIVVTLGPLCARWPLPPRDCRRPTMVGRWELPPVHH